jgi:class 3 adenylate cyclase
MAEERVDRRLAAILAADIAGYSRLMGVDEEGTLRQLKAHRKELIDPKITEHRGRVVKITGDGMLVEFVSVVDCVAARGARAAAGDAGDRVARPRIAGGRRTEAGRIPPRLERDRVSRPPGERNGQYRHGERTKVAIAKERKFSALLKMLRPGLT